MNQVIAARGENAASLQQEGNGLNGEVIATGRASAAHNCRNQLKSVWRTGNTGLDPDLEAEAQRSVRLQVVAGPRFEPATEDVALQVSALKMFGSLPKLGRAHWPHDAILLETVVMPGPRPGLPPGQTPDA
jgi:hypothetical protein